MTEVLRCSEPMILNAQTGLEALTTEGRLAFDIALRLMLWPYLYLANSFGILITSLLGWEAG